MFKGRTPCAPTSCPSWLKILLISYGLFWSISRKPHSGFLHSFALAADAYPFLLRADLGQQSRIYVLDNHKTDLCQAEMEDVAVFQPSWRAGFNLYHLLIGVLCAFYPS